MKNNKLGRISIILLGINSIIGSGIFLLPGRAYALAGTSSLFVFLFITILAGSMALCFAEASGLFQSNGSAYVYTKEAFGNFAGFEVGFMKYIVQIIAYATMSVGFTTALSALIPQVATGYMHTISIVSIITLLTIINLIGVNLVKYLNNAITVGKLIPLLIFIAVGLFHIQGSKFHPIVPDGFTIKGFSEASILIFYAFTGFEGIGVASEDMDNPKKNLPIAIASAMLSVALIYFLVQVISIGTLGTDLATTNTPIVDSIQTFLGPIGAHMVTLGTLVSIGGITLSASFATPRGCLALADKNMLPNVFKKKNKNNIPYVAILLTYALVLPIALSGSFVQLAVISVISRFAQYIPTCLSIIVFRRRGLESTFKVPFGYTIPLLATGVSIWLLIHTDPYKLLIGLGAMIIIIPIYFIMLSYNKKHNRTFIDAD